MHGKYALSGAALAALAAAAPVPSPQITTTLTQPNQVWGGYDSVTQWQPSAAVGNNYPRWGGWGNRFGGGWNNGWNNGWSNGYGSNYDNDWNNGWTKRSTDDKIAKRQIVTTLTQPSSGSTWGRPWSNFNNGYRWGSPGGLLGGYGGGWTGSWGNSWNPSGYSNNWFGSSNVPVGSASLGLLGSSTTINGEAADPYAGSFDYKSRAEQGTAASAGVESEFKVSKRQLLGAGGLIGPGGLINTAPAYASGPYFGFPSYQAYVDYYNGVNNQQTGTASLGFLPGPSSTFTIDGGYQAPAFPAPFSQPNPYYQNALGAGFATPNGAYFPNAAPSASTSVIISKE